MAIPAALRDNTLLSGLRSVGAEVIGEKLPLCKVDETIIPVDMELGNISNYKSGGGGGKASGATGRCRPLPSAAPRSMRGQRGGTDLAAPPGGPAVGLRGGESRSRGGGPA
ncbi:unnamed protein product [Bubo scandiacus]